MVVYTVLYVLTAVGSSMLPDKVCWNDGEGGEVLPLGKLKS